MISIKKWIRTVFGFSGNEINGFLILIPLMLLLMFSEPIYSTLLANRDTVNNEDARKLDSLASLWNINLAHSSDSGSRSTERPLFQFDPNTATVAELQSLGFSRTSAVRIAAYRRKGGRFRIKSDLLKIYGLDSALYKQLYTFILLPVGRQQAYLPGAKPRQDVRGMPLAKKESQVAFDINTADTTLLKTIYGIGSTLAARIVKFRDGLGGFINLQQLNEVYALDSMVVKRLLKVCFIREGFIPMKLNINASNVKQLSAHPYISYEMARALVTYRFQHGDFMEVGDIKKLPVLKTEEAERSLPYLKVSD